MHGNERGHSGDTCGYVCERVDAPGSHIKSAESG